MKKITLSEYNSISEAYRGVWTTERWDIPDWAEMRKKHIGKRTMMVYDNGTCLLVEGLSFEIVDDSSWKSRMRSERKSEAIILNSIQKKDVNLITRIA